jgi:hypothetical protein
MKSSKCPSFTKDERSFNTSLSVLKTPGPGFLFLLSLGTYLLPSEFGTYVDKKHYGSERNTVNASVKKSLDNTKSQF